MSQNSTIEWTDATWNPVRGCSRVSPGCLNCYAEKVATRFSDPGQPFHLFADRLPKPHWTGKVELVESHLMDPLKWRKPKRIFVNSMSDLFHEGLSDEAIDRVFAVMALCPQHTFQILTKRPDRMAKYLKESPPVPGWPDHFRKWDGANASVFSAMVAMLPKVSAQSLNATCEFIDTRYPGEEGFMRRWPLPNVWMGVSVENQPTADARIPLLLQAPAVVRFVSYEPALGPVDFTRINYTKYLRARLVEAVRWSAEKNGLNADAEGAKAAASVTDKVPERERPNMNALTGEWFDGWDAGIENVRKLDWIIIGGESGPGARPFDVAWARSTVQQCSATGVACFVKQLGAKPMLPASGSMDLMRGRDWTEGTFFGNRTGLKEFNGRQILLPNKKGGEMSEWPEDLRVREFPKC